MKDRINLGVVGAGGRVGLELLNLVLDSSNFRAACGVGKKSNGFLENVLDFSFIQTTAIDVFIDFSSAVLFERALEYCVQNKIPLVSGTTGLSNEQLNKLEVASKIIPILWAPNMSLGIAVLKKALGVFKYCQHFDFQVEEWHHRNKKDRPSGTAIFLQKELEKWVEKKGPDPLVMRAGGVYGVHKIYAVSDEEMIQFEHIALNRTIFARGALVAAEWILKKQSGLYSMDDVIA